MDDLISRQAAIDALMKRDKELRNINWYDKPFAEGECRGIDEALAIVSNLPSAQPQRKTGWWTKAYDGIDDHVKCTGCFKTYDWISQAQYYNYCPNCGADMRGEQDG